MRALKPQQKYDLFFREDAIALLRRSDRSMSEVAKSLGVPVSTLHDWYKGDMAKKRKTTPRREPKLPVRDPAAETAEEKLARLERENTALRKENDQLKLDREILKKAAAFFAKENE